jgi:hypothetical membrane protein
MSMQHKVEERRGTEEVGQGTSTFDPAQYHANIRTAWQAAAPFRRAWFDMLEAEEATVSMQDRIEERRGTEEAGQGTAQTRQPRPMIAALAAAGIVGPVVFAVVAVVQGLLRPGFSFVAQPVVALVAGPSGWVQDLNFVVLGAAMIAFAIGLHLGVLRPTRWAVVGPGLFALSGIGPLWAGLAGPRPVHFLLTFLGAATGLIVLSRPMARDPSWQRLAGYALTTGIAILVVIPLHSLLALPADAPLHRWWGLFNWSALTLWLTCTVVLARRLLRVARATPSTVTRDDHRT